MIPMITLRTRPNSLSVLRRLLAAQLPPASLALTLSLSLGLGLLAAGLTGCKSTPTVPPADDASLTHAVQSKIATDGAISSEPIQASVQNAVATLNGTVSSDAARSLAANDVAQVSGIKTVVNNLTVVQPPAPVAQASAPPPQPVRPEKADRHRDRNRHSQNVAQDVPSQQAQVSAPPPNPAAVAPPPPAAVAPPPPPPVIRTISLPADTVLPVRTNQTLDSATTQTGDVFQAVIANDIVVDDVVVLPQGTPVSGRVVAVQEAAHFKGNSLLTIELTTLDRKGEHIALTTDSFSKAGTGRGKNTAEKVGGGAAVGAILGGILGGGKGAAIGAAAGGGTGAGVNAVTKGQQVEIPAETLVRFHLSSPITVRITTRPGEPSDLQHHNQ
jgi:hypothetical protein